LPSQTTVSPRRRSCFVPARAAGTGTATIRFTLRPTVGAVNQTAEHCEQAVIPVADTLRRRRNGECGNALGRASRAPRTFRFTGPTARFRAATLPAPRPLPSNGRHAPARRNTGAEG